MNIGAHLRNILLSVLLGTGMLALGLCFTGVTQTEQNLDQFSRLLPNAAAGPLYPGPDLIIQSISITPVYPNPGQPVAIEVITKNQGDASADPLTSQCIETYLYVDPLSEPDLNTADTYYTARCFPLGAGQSFVMTYYNYVFTTQGCDHVIWAWTDRDQNVAEADEANNKVSIPVCVGTTPTPTPTPTSTPNPTVTPTLTPGPCVPDAYEASGDNMCAGASSISVDSVHQMHNLCPVGDEDWVKFNAQTGVSYTLGTANVGPDGNTVLMLYDQCDVPPTATSDPAFGNGVQIVWQPETSGLYYLKVKHHSETYGQDTNYELYVSPSTTCEGDALEIDDTCPTARDLGIGASPQTRQFCKPADADWAKFMAAGGATYSISAAAVGGDAQPKIELYDQCGYDAALAEGQPVSWIAPASKMYYVNVTNQDPDVFGTTTEYDLAVEMTACGPDGYEDDDTHTTAKSIEPGGAEQIHDICPAGDEDWVSFTAAAGQLYVIETFALAGDADTKICLFEGDGTTQIACDDDSGGGLASRINWTATSAGQYYLRVKHAEGSVGGPTTAYHLAISLDDPLDSYEPDNSAVQAIVIPTDGTPQPHNFTPTNDQDWVKFSVDTTNLPYVIQTDNLSGDNDTVLHLIDTDGTTELASNDDYGSTERSSITYIFPSTGSYYARVHHYRTNRWGLGTQYDLSVIRNYQPPTPTPTPTPPGAPSPTSTPSQSGIQTLIVTNRERLEALYGATEAQNVMDALALLASDTRVKGLILQAEVDSSAATAYTRWNNNQTSTTLANDTASAVRNMIMNALTTNPETEYIVIVGNDRVVPFRRTPDRTKYPESNYQIFVSGIGSSTIWAACHDKMSLTDDYYGDREPYIVSGQEVYVPDFAIGRLPEGPAEIATFINNFLSSDTIILQNVLVTGYDFVVDAAQAISNTMASDLGPGGFIDASLMGDYWQASALNDLQLNTAPAFNVQFINGHASHHLQGAPLGSGVNDLAIYESTENDLRRALVVTLGCHSGLNDVGDWPAGIDLAQAFFQRGANYIANTGYGWGSNQGLGWSERLVENYVQAFTLGSSTTIGKAMMTAKQQYWSESATFDAYDEKVLMESTLYGLPHFQLVSGGLLGEEDPFPSVVITPSLPLDSGTVLVGGLDFSLQNALGSLDPQQTANGTYFDINGNTNMAAGQPMQAGFYSNVTHAPAGRVHGITLDSAHYTDIGTLDPVISQPSNEWDNDWDEPAFTNEGWSPAHPVSLRTITTGRAFTDMVLAQLGQYHGQTSEQRLYDSMSLGVYYSSSPDWIPPEITYVGERVAPQGGAAIVKVGAWDLSGILGGTVTYTQGDGQWHSQTLVYNQDLNKWTASIPPISNILYFVQVVDNAGNVSVADHKGCYYELQGHNVYLYLPLTVKAQ